MNPTTPNPDFEHQTLQCLLNHVKEQRELQQNLLSKIDRMQKERINLILLIFFLCGAIAAAIYRLLSTSHTSIYL